MPPGSYEYRFVVDGQWVDDPEVNELIPNPFGSANAVLEVGVPAPTETVRPRAATRAEEPTKRSAQTPSPRATAPRGVLASGAAMSR